MLLPIQVIKTPDKVILTRSQIDAILREHIEKSTGRKVANNCVVTNSNSTNPITGEYRMSFELEPSFIKHPLDIRITGDTYYVGPVVELTPPPPPKKDKV